MGLSPFGLETGISLPNFTTSGIGFWITIVCISILFILIISVAVWMFYMNKLFNKKIIIFENIAGAGWRNTKKDTARIVKVGDDGMELLFLRKHKVYRTAYGKKMGDNTYWFAIGQDGYWYNAVLGDLDAKMGTLDIEPIDRDLRALHVAIRKNIQERYRKVGFMEKYGVLLTGGLFLIIMVICTWLLMSKAGDLIKVATQTMETAKPIIEKLGGITSNLDKICSNSGIRAA